MRDQSVQGKPRPLHNFWCIPLSSHLLIKPEHTRCLAEPPSSDSYRLGAIDSQLLGYYWGRCALEAGRNTGLSVADFPSCLRRLWCYGYANLSWTSAFPLDHISPIPTLSMYNPSPVHSQVLTSPARKLFHVDVNDSPMAQVSDSFPYGGWLSLQVQ